MSIWSAGTWLPDGALGRGASLGMVTLACRFSWASDFFCKGRKQQKAEKVRRGWGTHKLVKVTTKTTNTRIHPHTHTPTHTHTPHTHNTTHPQTTHPQTTPTHTHTNTHTHKQHTHTQHNTTHPHSTSNLAIALRFLVGKWRRKQHKTTTNRTNTTTSQKRRDGFGFSECAFLAATGPTSCG